MPTTGQPVEAQAVPPTSAYGRGSFHVPAQHSVVKDAVRPAAQRDPAAPAPQRLGQGVVLRWKNVAAETPASGGSATSVVPAAQVTTAPAGNASVFQSSAAVGLNDVFANPLRESTEYPQQAAVHLAAYQDPGPSNIPAPGLPPLPSQTETTPAQQPQIDLPENQDNGFVQPNGEGAVDPLLVPEPAPEPQGIPLESTDSAADAVQPPANPFPAAPPSGSRSPSDRQFQNPSRQGVQRTAISCDELRERVRQNTIYDVSLDVSPRYGEGLRSVHRDTEAERMDFAAQSIVRTWRNAAGEVIAEGRLIDLRDDHVVLDVEGQEQRIALWELSDADAAYVGEAWHIPLRCGRGYELYAEREFVPSAMQWKAPNHSHKPLYFEQPHLERYGHTLGPVLQPLVSTAHFFTTIPLLGYKAGIHPPYECQYPLGYYRPGDCVPQSIRPFPWSLRGAAVETAAVLGGGALIP